MDNKMNCNSFNVDNLIKHFLYCTPINTIDILISGENINCLVNSKKQQEILERTVNSDLIKKYPIKQSYQRAFLKWLMKKIEDEGGEIYDSIYTTYCNLISSTIEESIHYRHFLMENNCISIKESTNIISEGTTGLCSWQGAIELSNWCLGNKQKLFGKVILELGCGVGLTGLSIIKTCFPKQYIFTDCHKIVLEMVSENIKLNLLCNERKIEPELKHDRLKLQLSYNHTDVKIKELRWEDINKYVNEQWIIPDIVIGADILYDVNSFSGLISGLKGLLSFPNRYAIIAATIRNENTVLQFLYQLAHYDLSFKEYNIPQQTVHQKLASAPVKILKIFQK
ncbi:protein-lysine N-methyltransferase EEF2KMT [Bombus pyrosoma]|uniref:protein-lysine N-methyltransferase EEF2KMT n=1 Tax=Bombus pyrosoma TaxID=396416 RepID=UPI001CB963FD|nr:protein-lysine N-methyltransferase EEF2KMT [Bombus pyrosoma]XP_043602100.1 protein-lysine N-methyltransferase EEF2KMT [Bombus pyrosoma]